MTRYRLTNSVSKSIEEWHSLYEQKIGESFELLKGFAIHYLPHRGIANIGMFEDKKCIVLHEVSGDARFWHDYAELIGLGLGYEYMATVCTRSIYPYIRFWHWEILEEYKSQGQLRFLCKDYKGAYVVITQRGICKGNGLPSFWVTKYLREREKPILKEIEVNKSV